MMTLMQLIDVGLLALYFRLAYAITNVVRMPAYPGWDADRHALNRKLVTWMFALAASCLLLVATICIAGLADTSYPSLRMWITAIGVVGIVAAWPSWRRVMALCTAVLAAPPTPV